MTPLQSSALLPSFFSNDVDHHISHGIRDPYIKKRVPQASAPPSNPPKSPFPGHRLGSNLTIYVLLDVRSFEEGHQLPRTSRHSSSFHAPVETTGRSSSTRLMSIISSSKAEARECIKDFRRLVTACDRDGRFSRQQP